MISIRYELSTRHTIQGRPSISVTMIRPALVVATPVDEYVSAALENGDVGTLSLEFADGRKVTLGDVVVCEITRTVL